MNKKTYLFTIALAVFFSLNLFSQERGGRKKIKALKVSHITEKLSLSEQEAVKFWPVYNKFEKERYNLYHVKRSALKKSMEALGGIDNLSEKEAKVFAEKMLALEKASYESQVKYQKALSKFISYKKIVKLQVVEREFSRMLFDRYKNRKTRKLKKENK